MSRNEDEGRHPASIAHLQAARERGDVARSVQFAGAIQLLGVLLIGSLFAMNLSNGLQTFTQETWAESSINASQYDPSGWVWSAMKSVGFALAPVLALLFLVGMFSNIAQTGPMFVPNRVSMDVSRLSPSNWWQRVFSVGNFFATMMEIPKVLLVITIACAACYANWEQVVGLAAYEVSEMTSRMFSLILKIGFQTALVLLFFGVIDFAIQWMARQKRLRMTDQELREELRMQGNPEVLQRQRHVHRQRLNESS